MNRTKLKPTKQEIITAAKFAAILGGCTCNPDVTIRELSPGVYDTEIAHDAWCGHRSQQKGRDA